ncbi:hypothetical protein ABBQ38_013068 [Trebouxia sp. C0009 RCD-2024]
MFRGQDAAREDRPQRSSQRTLQPGQPSFMAAPLKKSDYVDLRTPVSGYVFSNYAYRANQDSEISRNLAELQQLRTDVLSSSEQPEQLCGSLIRYYQGLTVVQQHFPMGRKKDGILVEFPWYDAFQSNKRAASDSVAYEKASVLFNLAAVCSQQSLANDLATDGGLKGAARHFQEAAGYFKLLHDVAAPQLDEIPSFDISPSCTEMLELLMLAQAQESFYLKANRDKKNPAVLARLAAQVSQFYTDIEELNAIQQLRKYLGQVWTAHVHTKRALFAAIAQQHNAAVQMADDECGKALACLQEADRLAQEAHKTAGEGWRGPSVDKELAHSVEFHQSSIADAIEKANTDNARIYFQRVPSSVQQVQPAVMVTSATPQGLEPTREMDDWFRSLDNLSRSVGVFQQANSVSLPGDGQSRSGADDWAIGAASSGGSGRTSRGSSGSGAGVKAARGVGKFALGAAGKLASIALEELSKPGKVEGGRDRRAVTDAMPTSQPSSGVMSGDYEKLVDREVRAAIQRMQAAEDAKREGLRTWRLPESLKYLEKDKTRGAVPRVMQKEAGQVQGGLRYLGQLFKQLQEMRHNISEELERCEEELDREERYGGRRRSETAEFRETLAGYKQNLADAVRQDEKVDRKIARNQSQFEALDFNAAVADSRMSPASAFVATIRGALKSLDELSEERGNLEKAFRWEWDNDDILKGRTPPGVNPNQVFRDGLRRYDEINVAVEANLRKQAEVMHGIDANMQAFGDILQQNASSSQSVEQGFASLLREYNQVRDDVAQGLGFYGQLQEAVKQLHQEVGDYCLARYTAGSDRGSSGGRWLFGRGSPWSALPSASHTISLSPASGTNLTSLGNPSKHLTSRHRIRRPFLRPGVSHTGGRIAVRSGSVLNTVSLAKMTS